MPRRKTDLDFLETHVEQQLEHPGLAVPWPIGSTSDWLPSRKSTEHQIGALVMVLPGQVRSGIFDLRIGLIFDRRFRHALLDGVGLHDQLRLLFICEAHGPHAITDRRSHCDGKMLALGFFSYLEFRKGKELGPVGFRPPGRSFKEPGNRV